MLARLTRRFLALSVTAGVVTGLVLPGTASAAVVVVKPGDVTFEQWSRDKTPGWTTGNVGKGYIEGDVVPFRLTVTDAGDTPAGDSFVFSICRDFEEPAAPSTVERNGYLRLQDYDTSVAASLEGATEGNTTDGVTAAGKGATVQILSVTDDTTPANGDCAAGQRETEVEFSIAGLNGSDEAYILWGGRLASPFDAEVFPRDGAKAYSGSSLHMTFFPSKTLSANTSQMAAATPPPPPPPPGQAQLRVTKVVINDDEGTSEVGDFDLFVGQDQVGQNPVESGVVNPFAPGSYTVSEGAHEGYTSSIGGQCASDGTITLVAGENYHCTITNDDVPVDDPGSDDGDQGTDSNPPADTEVDSATETTNTPAKPVQTVQAPVSALPTTASPETPGPQTAPSVTSELPRTGAGVREQSQLALALLAAGLLSLALGRRPTRPNDV
jgi:hypothetical protein